LATSLLAATGLFFSASSANAQQGGEMKPVAVVTLSGYDALIEDVGFIGSLAGQPGAPQQLEFMIALATKNQGLAGFDKARPIGVVVLSDGASLSGGLCLPVTDFVQLLGTLEALGATSEEHSEGVLKIGTPQGQDLFAREINGWAFFVPAEAMLAALPDNPIGLFAPLTKEYDLGIRAYVQNIPPMFRQMAITQLQAGMEANMKPLPSESDEAFQARKEMTEAQMKQMEQMINDLDEVTIGLAIDSKQKRTFLDVTYTAVAGSELATKISQYSDAKTNYAGFSQPDAAFMALFSQKVTEADVVQTKQVFAALRKQVETAIDEEADLPSDEARGVMKSAMNDFFDAFLSTVEAGALDGGAVLNLGPDAATFVAGGFVADPSKVESGLKKLVELAKEDPNFPGLQWNSDQHANIRFHTMSVPVPGGGEGPRQLFGETLEVAIGIGQKSVYFAAGRDCLAATKSIIDRSAASPGQSVSPMEITLALGPVMDFAASLPQAESQPVLKAISKMLSNESEGRDHVRIVVQPVTGGLRTRFEMEEGVLKAIGTGAAAVMESSMEGPMEAQPAEAHF